jgi:hypothetical protein
MGCDLSGRQQQLVITRALLEIEAAVKRIVRDTGISVCTASTIDQ